MAARIAWLGTAIVFAVSGFVCVDDARAAFGVASMTFTGINGLTGSVTYYDKETTSEVTTPTVGIGQLTWNVTASTDPLVPVGPGFTTFCIELETFLHTPGTWNVGLVQNAPDPSSSSPFPSGQIGVARELALTKLYDIAYTSLGTSTELAAFQLAVWELTHETTNTFNVSTGNGTFYVSSGASPTSIATANTWLAAITGPPVTHSFDIYALTKADNQDQIFPVPVPPGGGNVPEATAMTTWGLIMLSMGFVTRRIRAVA